ncbi:MAG TPA: hypothetical protein VGM82_24780 [Gemmatimonadaceae bacterium]|jgi:hypothetical protein
MVKSTSGDLLRRVADRLGIDEIASTLAVQPAVLLQFLDGTRRMTLAQQRTLAVAVLLLCEGHDDLRRRATTLLGQVSAAAEFEGGTTQRHADPPPRLGWF